MNSNARGMSCLRKSVSTVGIVLLFFIGAQCCDADQFDTVRLYWQNYLITNAGSPASVAATANGYLSSMDTSPGRTYLWSYLPLGSASANLTTSFQQLEQMALAWAMPGSSLQYNSALGAAVMGGLDFMCTNYYTATTSEYGNWYDWEIGSPQALNNAAVLMYPALAPLELTNYVNAENNFSPGSSHATYGWMTGANTSDKALVAIICGILCKNGGQISSGQTNLSPGLSLCDQRRWFSYRWLLCFSHCYCLQRPLRIGSAGRHSRDCKSIARISLANYRSQSDECL